VFSKEYKKNDSPDLVTLAHPRMQLITNCLPPCLLGDEETKNLMVALEQLKSDIVENTQKLMDDKHWVDQVKLVLGEYEVKMRKVLDQMGNLRTVVGKLYTKKTQVENLLVQKNLEDKLEETQADMAHVEKNLQAATLEESRFMADRTGLLTAISNIKTQLRDLNNPNAK